MEDEVVVNACTLFDDAINKAARTNRTDDDERDNMMDGMGCDGAGFLILDYEVIISQCSK